MEAHLCWAGSRNGAVNGVVCALLDIERSDVANRTALSRGGMAVGDLRAAGVLAGISEMRRQMMTKLALPRGLTVLGRISPAPSSRTVLRDNVALDFDTNICSICSTFSVF